MERSSRFISLSGWSGVAAGLCALAGAGIADGMIDGYRGRGLSDTLDFRIDRLDVHDISLIHGRLSGIDQKLLVLASIVFVSACLSAFFFTYLRSKKEGMPLWGTSSKRLMWNTLFPIAIGGLVILRMLERGEQILISPLCLIFYGLALINGSKFTLGEIKYLGYLEILLGIINLWTPGQGLIFWALGFGVLHIIYGILMWWKYERT